jgi:hypothetical protein
MSPPTEKTGPAWLASACHCSIGSAVAAGVIAEPADIDMAANGTCAIADGLGIQVALGHRRHP